VEISVRFRDWVLNKLDADAPADPDEPAELVVVRAPIGPMTVASLQANGFSAAGYETASWKGIGSYRILVPRHQLQDATEFLTTIL
jgi:hypothetical protein